MSQSLANEINRRFRRQRLGTLCDDIVQGEQKKSKPDAPAVPKIHSTVSNHGTKSDGDGYYPIEIKLGNVPGEREPPSKSTEKNLVVILDVSVSMFCGGANRMQNLRRALGQLPGMNADGFKTFTLSKYNRETMETYQKQETDRDHRFNPAFFDMDLYDHASPYGPCVLTTRNWDSHFPFEKVFGIEGSETVVIFITDGDLRQEVEFAKKLMEQTCATFIMNVDPGTMKHYETLGVARSGIAFVHTILEVDMFILVLVARLSGDYELVCSTPGADIRQSAHENGDRLFSTNKGIIIWSKIPVGALKLTAHTADFDGFGGFVPTVYELDFSKDKDPVESQQFTEAMETRRMVLKVINDLDPADITADVLENGLLTASEIATGLKEDDPLVLSVATVSASIILGHGDAQMKYRRGRDSGVKKA